MPPYCVTATLTVTWQVRLLLEGQTEAAVARQAVRQLQQAGDHQMVVTWPRTLPLIVDGRDAEVVVSAVERPPEEGTPQPEPATMVQQPLFPDPTSAVEVPPCPSQERSAT